MPADQPRTYKYQLTADEFIFAFTASDTDFTARADEMRGKGVERLTGEEIESRYSIETGYDGEDEPLFTCINETNIQADAEERITLLNIQQRVPDLVLRQCSLPALYINKCTLAEVNEGDITDERTSFILSESTTGDFSIEDKSTTGDFSIFGASTTGDFTVIGTSTTEDFRISEASTTGNFIIDGASMTGDFWISGESTTGDFTIIGTSITGGFHIDGSNTTGSFIINGASTTENFNIDGASTTGEFIIDEASMTGDFWISGESTTGDFSIIGTSITGSFWINEASKTGNFWIEDKSTTGNFRISGSQCGGFTASDLYASFYLQAATIPQFRLTNCHIPTLEIRSGCKLEAYLATCTINLIDLQHLTLSKDSVVSLFGCRAYACLMEEFAVLGQLYLRQVKPLSEPFVWYDPVAMAGENPDEAMLNLLQRYSKAYTEHRQTLIGKGDEQLNLSTPTFRIVQSSLGKTEFTNCDLGGFRFEFNNAKITEVFMSGGTVPGEKVGNNARQMVSIYGEPEGELAWHEQKVSLYNQLKKIFDNQGDIYRATFFQAKTAEHQRRSLKLRQNDEDGWLTPTRWDIWTLQLNQFSNLHGESWGRALGFTLGVAAVFYVLFLWSIGRLFLPTPLDQDLIGQYFEFLLPTHKTDFVKGATLNVGSYLADFVGRVLIGYGIFQFINAFRRHGKK